MIVSVPKLPKLVQKINLSGCFLLAGKTTADSLANLSLTLLSFSSNSLPSMEFCFPILKMVAYLW